MGFSYKPLWRLLLERNISKTEYRKLLGLSSSTVAKMGKEEYVALEILDKTCTYFDVTISEVIEHKK